MDLRCRFRSHPHMWALFESLCKRENKEEEEPMQEIKSQERRLSSIRDVKRLR